MMVPFMKTAAQGGDSILYAGLSPEFEGQTGQYTDNSQVISPHSAAFDLTWQKRMWDMSLELTGLKNFIDGREWNRGQLSEDLYFCMINMFYVDILCLLCLFAELNIDLNKYPTNSDIPILSGPLM